MTTEETIEPIAAKLPAEPGWRAIQFEVVGEIPTNDDEQVQLKILIVPIAEWALSAPKIEAAVPDRLLMMKVRQMFPRNFFPPSVALEPIDPRTGQRMQNIHRLVAPSALTDDELIAQTQLWVAETNETINKPWPKTSELKEQKFSGLRPISKTEEPK